MQRIELAYMEGDHTRCLALTLDEFSIMGNHYTFKDSQSRVQHKCERDPNCKCARLAQYIIALSQDSTADIEPLLAQHMLEPATRLAFPALLAWIKVLVFKERQGDAEELIKAYISASTSLKAENANEPAEEEKPLWLRAKSGELGLSEAEYTDLVEILIFAIYLPQIGYRATCDKLKSAPLPKNIKADFESRLVQVRNLAAADVQLSNNKPIQNQQTEVP